ncbi:MAG TPA: Pycsar system effector family protein [Solimonas sp.]|nr:Pycsar system effector family protein [Solimonas sp.]
MSESPVKYNAPTKPVLELAPGAHLDQLLRQTRVHHMQLSTIADQKAAMLLTVSSVVLTLSTQYLADPHYRWAAAILIGFSLLTVGLASVAAMPKIGLGRARQRPQGTRNVLFFGYFTQISYEQFLDEMAGVMNSAGATYEAQLREIYELGQYLQKEKYRYIRLGYLSFMAGLVSSACAWTFLAFR